MKKKRFAALLVAAPLALLAGCSSTPSLELNQNWFYNTGLKDIPDGFIETLEYAVTFEKSDSAVKNKFSTEYSDGVYKTTFKSAPSENGQLKYVYETEFSVNVRFVLGENSTEIMHDTVTTHVEFLEAQNNLKPLLSWREAYTNVPNSSPSNPPSSLEKGVAYGQYDYKTEIVYDYDSSKANFKITYFNYKWSEETKKFEDVVETKAIKLKAKGLIIDNEQLIPVLRAAELSSSMPLYTIDYTTKTLEKLAVKEGPTNVDSHKQKVKLNGEEEATEHDFKVTTLGIAYNKKNPGRTQTFTLARRDDSADRNISRNVLLEYSQPAINSHGTMTYKLIAANFYN